MNLNIKVPGSTSNLGAGFDFVGLALEIFLTADVRSGSGKVRYRGTLEALTSKTDHVASLLSRDELLRDFDIDLHSDIPVGRGLGSSASARVAAELIRRHATSEPCDRDDVFDRVAELEGHPDNAAPAVYGGLIFVGADPRKVKMHDSLRVALAVPEQTVSTHEARNALPQSVPREVAVDQAARASALLQGLTEGDGDLIGWGMGDVIAVPKRAGLIRGFGSAAEAALKLGAFGVTISGSGSTTVAICTAEMAEAVAAEMAAAFRKAGNPASAIAPAVALGGFEVS